jgi:hypothetical protein
LSRILFKILKNLKILKKVSRFLDYPNLLRFFKIMMLKNSFYLCNNKYPWYAKVRENRSFREHRFKLEDPSSQSFMCNQNLSRYWLFRTARNHKIPHYAKEPIPSKLTNTQGVERGYSIPNPHQKQKILKTIHFRKLYIIEN